MPRALLMTLTLTCLSQAHALVTTFGPEHWPDLERVAKQVPEFSGFTLADRENRQVTFLALTDKAQTPKLRQVLKADPYWRGKLTQIEPGSLKLKSSVLELLQVARAVKKTNPKLSVRIDTALNRVTVNADLNVVLPLRQKLGVGDILQKEGFFQNAPFKYDVQPRAIRKSLLNSEARWGGVPNLRVLVTNPADRPQMLGYGCGGAMPVHVLTADGQRTKAIEHLGCTSELRMSVLQPQETRTFRSFSGTDLSKLPTGRYFWQQTLNSPRYPFELKP